MTPTILAGIAALVVGGVSPAGIKPWLRRRGVIDVPSTRSSHSTPTLRGGGLSAVAAVIAGYTVYAAASGSWAHAAIMLGIVALSTALAGIGWADDIAGLAVGRRAGLQVVVGLACGLGAGYLFGLPLYAVPAVALFVAAYTNIANFMDGVNSISCLHGIVVGVVFMAVGTVAETPWLVGAGVVVGAAYLAFLPWNVAGSRLFLGDVGSYLLGGCISVVAVFAIADGVELIGVVGVLAIYAADTGATLLLRVVRRERWYESHRLHRYHQLEDAGFGHTAVALTVSVFGAATGVVGVAVTAAVVDLAVGLVAIGILVAVYLALPVVVRRSRSAASRFGGVA